MKYLSIVIPFYDETYDEVLPNLQMINSQIGIDFNEIEVVLVNDGIDNIAIETAMEAQTEYAEWKFDYSFIYMSENKGPGLARQRGIDESKGLYVMFCDADDSLHNVGILQAFLSLIKRDEKFDIIRSKWIEEIVNQDGNFIYQQHDIDMTWMHGNVYKKSFLDYYNIRFHDELRVHEDSYFQAIAAERTNNVFNLDAVTYIWRYRPSSIVRCNNSEYTYSSNAVFYDSIRYSFDEIHKFKEEALFYKVTQLLFYGYFNFLEEGWQTEQNKDYYLAAIEAYRNCIGKYINFFLENSKENVDQIYRQEFNRKNRPIPTVSVTDFLVDIGILQAGSIEEGELE